MFGGFSTQKVDPSIQTVRLVVIVVAVADAPFSRFRLKLFRRNDVVIQVGSTHEGNGGVGMHEQQTRGGDEREFKVITNFPPKWEKKNENYFFRGFNVKVKQKDG